MRRILLVCSMMLLPWLARAEGLPDFADLVERESASVVNISTTQTPKAEGPGDGKSYRLINDNDVFCVMTVHPETSGQVFVDARETQ